VNSSTLSYNKDKSALEIDWRNGPMYARMNKRINKLEKKKEERHRLEVNF
jgi:hypothetical protein